MPTIQCPQCLNLNPADAEICLRCNAPLDRRRQVKSDARITIGPNATASRSGRGATIIEDPKGGSPIVFEVGQTLFNKYTLVRKLGDGGMAEVWLGEMSDQIWLPEHRIRERQAAFKLILPEYVSNERVLSRMKREWATLSKIEHPNVISVYEYFQLGNAAGLVLEYMNRGSLADLIDRKGAQKARDTVKFMRKILAGLGALHDAALIHRDIKPDNILLSKVKGQIEVKIADLGIVKDQGEQGQTYQTQLHTHLGTLPYMSPEQVKGLEPTAASDIYSCGIMFYEMLTGTVPFEGGDLDVRNSHVKADPDWSRLPNKTPKYLTAALQKALSKDPGKRFKNCSDFSEALKKKPSASGAEVEQPSNLEEGRGLGSDSSSSEMPMTSIWRKFFVFERQERASTRSKAKWLAWCAVSVLFGVLVAHFVFKEGRFSPSDAEAIVMRGSSLVERVIGPAGFRRIPSGTFMMGTKIEHYSEARAFELLHPVTLTNSFFLQETEVTQREYEGLMGRNPSQFKDPNYPVHNVSWFDAINYANALSRKNGLRECYLPSGKVRNGGSVYRCTGYRLPTESEWEYAARAGDSGEKPANLASVAWSKGVSNNRVHSVGQKEANDFGLYDMLGNVWEWVHDGEKDYQSDTRIDPEGAKTNMRSRMIRGGHWSTSSHFIYFAKRRPMPPRRRSNRGGFRLARTVH